ncbi:MAG: Ni/Fe-hydrogenase, b-type cytochrome subunit [Rhodobacter sp.]|nr:Ni/Fe-hydrogenase, b-type cytochrome subunit [Rhodobacter sp.]
MSAPTTDAPFLTEPDADAADLASATRQTSVYVYEAPLRIWHWVNAAAILVLCLTGYLIGSPPPTMIIDEATHQFVFGYIRFAHFAAGWVLVVGFLGRIYWAIFGNHHARQLFYLPIFNGRWWKEVWFEIKWYLFLERAPKKYVGHNPLAQLAMFFFITLGVSFMIVTGLALYSEGLGQDSTLYKMFGWVFTMVGGNSHVVHTIHHLGMWWIIIFMIIHIYVAIREDIMSRQSIVSTMISGHRTFKDDRPD